MSNNYTFTIVWMAINIIISLLTEENPFSAPKSVDSSSMDGLSGDYSDVTRAFMFMFILLFDFISNGTYSFNILISCLL